MLKARASMFFLFGIILLFLLLSSLGNMDIVQKGLFVFMIALLFFGAIATYIASFKGDEHRKELDTSKPIFQCRHCGEQYNDEKMKNRHEKSCVKMKI